MDPKDRFVEAIKTLQLTMIDFPAVHPPSEQVVCFTTALKTWKERCTALAIETFEATRQSYFANPDPTPLLGAASKRMYRFVREELEVPFLHAEEACAQVNEAIKPSDDESVAVDEKTMDTANTAWTATTLNEGSHTQISRPISTLKACIPTGIQNPTIGANITKIYNSIRTGALYVLVIECLKEV